MDALSVSVSQLRFAVAMFAAIPMAMGVRFFNNATCEYPQTCQICHSRAFGRLTVWRACDLVKLLLHCNAMQPWCGHVQ